MEIHKNHILQCMCHMSINFLRRCGRWKMFKHYGFDAGEGSFSVCIPQVLTSTAQVKHFWDQLRSAAPREKREHIARTEWMMSTWDC